MTEATKSSGPITFESAQDVFKEAFRIHVEDGNETFENLELAAAQLAICLSVEQSATTVPNVADVRDRVAKRKSSDTTKEAFDAKDLLGVREQAFYEASRTIVGLVYQAARMNTQTVTPSPAITRQERRTRRSAVL